MIRSILCPGRFHSRPPLVDEFGWGEFSARLGSRSVLTSCERAAPNGPRWLIYETEFRDGEWYAVGIAAP